MDAREAIGGIDNEVAGGDPMAATNAKVDAPGDDAATGGDESVDSQPVDGDVNAAPGGGSRGNESRRPIFAGIHCKVIDVVDIYSSGRETTPGTAPEYASKATSSGVARQAPERERDSWERTPIPPVADVVMVESASEESSQSDPAM